MKKLQFVRSIASVCHVLFSIFQVFSVIAAVFLLIAVLLFSLLPAETVVFNSFTEIEADFNFRNIYGDLWDEVRTQMEAQFGSMAELTENGLIVRETVPADKMTNHSMSLLLVPMMVEYLICFFLFRFFSRAFKAIKENAFSPFSQEAANSFRSAGYTMFFLGIAPSLAGFLVELLTGFSSGVEMNMDQILIGFILLAAAALFEYALSLIPAPAVGSSGPIVPPSAPSPTEGSDSDNGANGSSDQNGPFHPDAF
ncbi:MAG: hypothetical protein IKD31_01540 [Clostridia bacterium]|nr:hypothetical protein [Clostridia bacterium]